LIVERFGGKPSIRYQVSSRGWLASRAKGKR
jgi:hypothetical protein